MGPGSAQRGQAHSKRKGAAREKRRGLHDLAEGPGQPTGCLPYVPNACDRISKGLFPTPDRIFNRSFNKNRFVKI